MKKKIGAILAAGVMACTMTAGVAFASGCGAIPADFNMPEGGFDTTKSVEIKFYHTMGQGLRDVLDSYIVEFNKLYPNITVNHEQIGGYDDVRDQISKEIIAGNQPNIAYCYPDHVAQFNRAGAVQNLNGFLPDGAFKDVKVTQADGTEVSLNMTKEEKDHFIKGYYDEGYKFGDGKRMFTLPFSKSTEVLYYNATFFQEHQLTVPTTWDEMESVCAKIKEIDPECIPFGYDSEANWFITMCEQHGSDYTSSTGNKYRFDNKTNRAFVEKFKGWYDKGYFTTQEIYGSYTSGLFTATTGQRSYMCIGSSAGASHQAPTATNGVYPFEVGITSIPQVNAKKPKVISQGPSVCIFKKDNPQEVLASWLFLKYLTTSVEFQAEFSIASGYVPVLNLETMKTNQVYASKLDSANGTTNLTALAAKVCMEQENAYYTSPAFVGSSKARTEVGLLLQAVFTGSKTLDKAFKDAIEECEYYSG